MTTSIRSLVDTAENEILREAINPTIEQLKQDVLKQRADKLASLIEEEKAKILASPDSLESSAKDLATLSVHIERQNSLFGYKKGTNYYVAARLYMQGRKIPEIEKETGIPRNELRKLINHKITGWKFARERMMESIAQELRRENLPILKKLSQMGLSLIEKAFEERLRQIDDPLDPKPVSLGEATQVATIMAFVAKEKRLDEETDIQKHERSLTPTEIFKQFAEDPYLGKAFKKMIKDVVPIETEPIEITVNESRNPIQP